MNAVVAQLKYYPIILVVCWFWGTVNRIHQSVTGKHTFWLTLLQTITMQLTGLANATAYGATPAVRDQWARLFQHMRQSRADGASCCALLAICFTPSASSLGDPDQYHVPEAGVQSDKDAEVEAMNDPTDPSTAVVPVTGGVVV